MPKLFGEKKSSVASDSYFEFNGGETPQDNSCANCSDSLWCANGQPATLVFQNVKRTQDELNKLFAIAGLEHFRRVDEAT